MGLETQSIPLFPLPNVVFFPSTLLPLHIFEPRYKEMVADALDSDSLIGVVQLRPGWEEDYHGEPPIYKMVGVGRILNSNRWEDGRYDILLAGMHRGQILREGRRGQYRTAEIEIVRDESGNSLEGEPAGLYNSLVPYYRQLAATNPDALLAVPEEWKEQPPAGLLADLLANALVENPYDKQCILGEPDVDRRLRLMNIQVQNLLKPNP